MLKVVELFAGIGAQATALENLGIEHECVISEIDEHAIRMYNAIHGETPNLGDITKVEHLPECDLVTWSFPCCPAGTLIRTADGHVPIENVREGDLVLTHENRFRPVVRTMSRVSPEIYVIKAVGCELYLTDEHPLYVHRDGVFQWVKVADLRLTDRLCYNINGASADPPHALTQADLWLLGKYVADGSVDTLGDGSVEIRVDRSKDREFKYRCPARFRQRARAVAGEGFTVYRAADDELARICLEFGADARCRYLPSWVADMPVANVRAFLDGFLSGVGRMSKGYPKVSFPTASAELFAGLQECILKAYGVVCSKYMVKDRMGTVYNGRFPTDGSETFAQTVIGSKAVVDIRSMERIRKSVAVYNLEVEEDNSYTAYNVIVHNCQDLSIAGNRKGMEKGSGTRSSLGWEVVRLIADAVERGCPPKHMLMENVPAITFRKNLPEFNRIIDALRELGYVSSWKILNAKDFGVPQNRARCFMVSEYKGGIHTFPKGKGCELRLKDVLEKDVPETYYLSEERIATYERHRERQEENGCGFGWRPLHPEEENAIAITTNPQRNCTSNYIYDAPKGEPAIEIAGRLDNGSQQNGTVYDADGISPALMASAQEKCNHVRIEDPEVRFAGRLESGSQFNQATQVLDGDGISPALTTTHPGIGLPKVEVEVEGPEVVVAGSLNIPGRYESALRVYGTEGAAPTLPTGGGGGIMPKIEEPSIVMAGHLTDTPFEQAQRVYDTEGPAPAMKARDYKEPSKIEEPDSLAYPSNTSKGYMDAYEGDGVVMCRPTKARGTVQPQSAPTLTTGNGGGSGVVVRDADVPELKYIGILDCPGFNSVRHVYDSEGVSPAVTTNPGNMRPKIEVGDDSEILPDIPEGGVAPMLTPGREDKRQNGRRFKEDGDDSFTVTTSDRHGVATREEGRLRIRYLTERECWRLMGFDDERIDRAFAVEKSKSARYKAAGNSIVVDVLMAIFDSMYLSRAKSSQRSLLEFRGMPCCSRHPSR